MAALTPHPTPANGSLGRGATRLLLPPTPEQRLLRIRQRHEADEEAVKRR